MTKRKSISRVKRIPALALAVCLALTLVFGASAASTTNTAVQDDMTGVLQVQLVYNDPDKNEQWLIQTGTGFLINESSVVTASHVVTLDDETLLYMEDFFGKDEAAIKNNLQIQITYLRDTTPITASVTISSAEMDFAVLNMNGQIYNRTYLRLRSSATVEQTENVYALGFPGEVSDFQDVNTWTSDDINVYNGVVGKISTINGVDYIQSSTAFTGGVSGGPLVDDDGCVIGIVNSYTGTLFDSDYYYSVAIDQLIEALDLRGIEYTSCTHMDGDTALDTSELESLISQAQSMDTSSASADAITALQSALNNARDALSTASSQSELDSAASALSQAISGISSSSSNTSDVVNTEPDATVNKSELQSLCNAATATDTSDYTEDSVAAFETALSDAQAILSSSNVTQSEVDRAYANLSSAIDGLETGGFSLLSSPILLIIIAVVVVLIILVIVILLLTRKSKKKKTDDYAYAGGAAPAQEEYYAQPNQGAQNGQFSPYTAQPVQYQQAQPPYSGQVNGTSVIGAGAGETSVLNAGAGETSVLAQNCGTLIRKKTGEAITVNSASFIIGKEQSKVNYCVQGNTSVSRTHATITMRNGVSYIMDMQTTNGTFVNGVRINPMQERELKDGDSILLADEEFTFRTH